jgi:large subunit ribosomal protein L24
MEKTGSSKPKKQRRFHYRKALDRKQHSLAGHLAKPLREKLGMRSVSLRKGDSVKVMRGKKRGSSGKLTGVDYGKGVVFIESVVRKKANGEEIPLPVQASNLLVTELNADDARRFKRKKGEK